MSEPPVKYNVAFAKGHGLQDETIALLRAWAPGMTNTELTAAALQQGLLRRATAKRTQDIIFGHIAPRYFIDQGRPARYLKILLESGLPASALNQLFFIYTCRANPILRDFIGQVYWPSFQAGRTTIIKEQALEFIDLAVQAGHIPVPWTSDLRDVIARGLMTCLADFDLAEKGRVSGRKLRPFQVSQLTTFYLAHELHFIGLNDNQIMTHPDWQLFGLTPVEVVYELQHLPTRHLIVQFSGDLLRISWILSSMEEALDAIAAREL